MEKTRLKRKELTEEEIDKLLAEKFDQKFPDYESFKQDLEEKIEKAQKDIEEGRGIPMEVVVANFKKEYGF